uniref:Uncharacterized protein n=1 Tax=viral metagenome TaxID=1070528 RepID=A0A6C0JMQ4_9ZZZZ
MSIITGLYLSQNTLVEGYKKIVPTKKEQTQITIFVIITITIILLLAASDKNPNIIAIPTMSS